LLNPEAFLNIPIVYPPLEEQKAIVAFLEEQTAVINQFLTNKRRLIELLTEQKQVVINTAVTQGLDTTVPRKPSGIKWLEEIPLNVSFVQLTAKLQKIAKNKNRTFTNCSNVAGS
jgi:type I restriction enzyme, S subunit